MDISEFKRTHQESNSDTAAFIKEALAHDHPIKSIANGVYIKLRGLFQRYPVPTLFVDGSQLLERKVQRIAHERPHPVFAYVNLMEGHGLHQPSLLYRDDIYSGPLQWSSNELPDDDFIDKQNIDRENLEHLRSLYASAIEYLDRRVMKMIETWRVHLDGETTFIVTADHGENLGYEADDFRVGHEASLSEGVIHVPMEIINPPSCDLPDESELYSHQDFGELMTSLAHDTWTVSPRSMVAAERIGTEVDNLKLDTTDMSDARRMIRAVVADEKKYV